MTFWKQRVAVYSRQEHQCQRYCNISNIMFFPIWHTNMCNRLAGQDDTLEALLLHLVNKNIKETHSSVALFKSANCHKFCIRTCETGYAGHVERNEVQSKHPRERTHCEHRQCVAKHCLFFIRFLSRGSFDVAQDDMFEAADSDM